MVSKVLVQPRSDLFLADKAFAPTSLVVDSIGTVYATCEGIYNGAVMLDPDNHFLGYFGSNEVKLTASLLIDRFWKSLLSSKARSQLANYIPVEMTSLEIGRDDFVYTCTLETDDVTASVRKINPFGSNILKSKAQSSFQGGFGDLQPFTYDNQTYTTRFIDLCVDENQAIFALDYTSGRVFQYDEEGNLLFVFGGIGNQKGLFISRWRWKAWEAPSMCWTPLTTISPALSPRSLEPRCCTLSTYTSKASIRSPPSSGGRFSS